MKPGDLFDPVDVTRTLKLYPVDAVDARRAVSDGPKRLYAQLFRIAVTTDRRKNPWLGYIYASERFLAGRLGKSESGIRRDLAALRSVGLVRVERPDKTQNNRYYFIWDATFDSADVSGQDQPAVEDDGADVRSRDSAHVSAHIRSDSADLGGHDSADVSGLYKEKQRVEATPGNAPRAAAPNIRTSPTPVRSGFEEFRLY